MQPKHVKDFWITLHIRNIRGMGKKTDNKDMDWLCVNPMYWMVFMPSLCAIGMGIIPFVVMFIFFEKPEFLKP